MVTAKFDDEEMAEARLTQTLGQNVIRACLFNLIVLSDNIERTAHLNKLIQIIAEKFPCRIILVQEDPTVQMDFIRENSTTLSIISGSNSVVCDKITIESSQNQFHKIPFLILPHIVPDLPIYILLGHDPSHDNIVLPKIQQYSSRVIFDPESIDNYSKFSQRILPLIESSTTEFIDMNWGRTKAWREIIARVFNNPEKLDQLKKCKTIQISYVRPANHKKNSSEVQAIYIQAWLAARLGWNYIGTEHQDGYTRISYKYDHVGCTVSLTPKDTELLDEGSIFSFEAMTEGDYHFLFSHDMESKLIKIHGSNPERCEIPYTIFLPNFQSGPALVSEIFYQLPGAHYRAMLQMLSHHE